LADAFKAINDRIILTAGRSKNFAHWKRVTRQSSNLSIYIDTLMLWLLVYVRLYARVTFEFKYATSRSE